MNLHVGIIGVGLMGGSLALSLKKLPFVQKVFGHDHNKKHQEDAIKLNLVDEMVDFEGIKQCDVIFLAIPVDGIIKTLKNLDGISDTCTILDLGSTKEIIVNNVPQTIRKNFVAAHPMTGTENFGPQAAIENLYKDQVVVLCDLEESGEHQQNIAIRLFSALHMKIAYMRAHEHDRHAAFISHMPHLISFSIANTVLKQEDKYNILAMAATGFRSMSRLAKSSPHMWEDIFRQNQSNLIESIEHFEVELAQMKKALKSQEWQELHKKMQNANKLQDIFS